MKTKATDWTYDGDYVTTVESHSQRGKFYDIKRTRGVLTCECSSYKFSKAPKTCKHLIALGASTAAEPRVTITRPRSKTNAEPVLETFTFRRRLSLGQSL